MPPEPLAYSTSQHLNMCCALATLDRQTLEARLARDLTDESVDQLRRTHAHLFADEILYLNRRELDEIEGLVRAIEQMRHSEIYLARVLPEAGAGLLGSPGTLGVFTSYDFHLTPAGPRLIEINTNAGGAFLAAAAGANHRGCCGGLGRGILDHAEFETRVVDMFVAEWSHAGRSGRPQTIAIVDEDPQNQFLYPEFLLVRALFRRSGIETIIADPSALAFTGEELSAGGRRIDLVYNRHTDFRLKSATLSPLRDAMASDAVVVTPHPFHHASLANKANMIAISDASLWAECGLPPEAQQFAALVPRTIAVTPANADALWQDRKAYYFKPLASHASKGVYRGAKLTRHVWSQIVAGSYVAQEAVDPGKRLVNRDGAEFVLKADLRVYTYGPQVILLAARLYHGQTTNMRTPGGGFAPVVLV